MKRSSRDADLDQDSQSRNLRARGQSAEKPPIGSTRPFTPLPPHSKRSGPTGRYLRSNSPHVNKLPKLKVAESGGGSQQRGNKSASSDCKNSVPDCNSVGEEGGDSESFQLFSRPLCGRSAEETPELTTREKWPDDTECDTLGWSACYLHTGSHMRGSSSKATSSCSTRTKAKPPTASRFGSITRPTAPCSSQGVRQQQTSTSSASPTIPPSASELGSSSSYLSGWLCRPPSSPTVHVDCWHTRPSSHKPPLEAHHKGPDFQEPIEPDDPDSLGTGNRLRRSSDRPGNADQQVATEVEWNRDTAAASTHALPEVQTIPYPNELAIGPAAGPENLLLPTCLESAYTKDSLHDRLAELPPLKLLLPRCAPDREVLPNSPNKQHAGTGTEEPKAKGLWLEGGAPTEVREGGDVCAAVAPTAADLSTVHGEDVGVAYTPRLTEADVLLDCELLSSQSSQEGAGGAKHSGACSGLPCCSQLPSQRIPLMRQADGRKILCLVRHGESTFNEADASAKSFCDPMIFDPPLTEKGCAQSQGLQPKLRALIGKYGPPLWVVSPLTRAIQTFLLACPLNVGPGSELSAAAMDLEPGPSAAGPGTDCTSSAVPVPATTSIGEQERWLNSCRRSGYAGTAPAVAPAMGQACDAGALKLMGRDTGVAAGASRAHVEVTPLIAEYVRTTGEVGRPASHLMADFPQLSDQLIKLDEQWWFQDPEHPNSAVERQLQSLEGKEQQKLRLGQFKSWLGLRPETFIVLVGHSSFWSSFLPSSQGPMENGTMRLMSW